MVQSSGFFVKLPLHQLTIKRNAITKGNATMEPMSKNIQIFAPGISSVEDRLASVTNKKIL